MFALIHPASGGETGGLAVVLPPLYEIFWSALILLLILLAVGRYALPKIYAMLDERQAKIEEGLNAAEKAREEHALAARDREEVLRAAHEEAHAIRERAREDATRIVATAREDATAEAQRIQEAASRQILAEKQAAQITLRTDIGMLATELAEKIVGEHLTNTELTSRVVDRFLDELENDQITAGGAH